jgi:predicted MFS family arabinose efflux permease
VGSGLDDQGRQAGQLSKYRADRAFVAAVVLLGVFLLIESRTRQPITPLHMFRNRNRAGSYAIMLCLAAGLLGMFFFLTLFVQNVLGYSPLKAGLAFLPVRGVIIVASQLVSMERPAPSVCGSVRAIVDDPRIVICGLEPAAPC